MSDYPFSEIGFMSPNDFERSMGVPLPPASAPILTPANQQQLTDIALNNDSEQVWADIDPWLNPNPQQVQIPPRLEVQPSPQGKTQKEGEKSVWDTIWGNWTSGEWWTQKFLNVWNPLKWGEMNQAPIEGQGNLFDADFWKSGVGALSGVGGILLLMLLMGNNRD